MLGHIICERGIKVDRFEINLIRSLPSPTSVKEVCFFLSHARLLQDNITPLQLALKEYDF